MSNKPTTKQADKRPVKPVRQPKPSSTETQVNMKPKKRVRAGRTKQERQLKTLS